MMKISRLSSLNLFTNSKARKIASPILIILLWEAIARSGVVPSYFLPSPTHIVETGFALLASGELVTHIFASLKRALPGFFIGATLGILLGMAIGWWKFVEDIADIPLQFLRAIPIAALIPLAILWFGLGDASKIFIVMLPPFFITLVNTIAGVRSVDILMVKAARSLGAKDRHILREVLMPGAAPMIFAGLRLAVVISFCLLIIVEMVAANAGLGYLIMDSERVMDIKAMFVGIIVIAVIGFSFDRIVIASQNKLLAWHKGKTISAA